MQALVDAPELVELGLSRAVIVREERTFPYLEIVGGNSCEVAVGTNLRKAIQVSKSELYRGMAKARSRRRRCGSRADARTDGALARAAAPRR